MLEQNGRINLKANTNTHSNALYLAALKPQVSIMKNCIKSIWLIAGLAALIGFAFAEPWSSQLFRWMLDSGFPQWLVGFVLTPLVMAIRAVIAVESVGYAYHRFGQHLGYLTRRAQAFRRNQRFHWIHHMVIYPVGRRYRLGKKYISAEKGFGLSWVIPALLGMGLFIAVHGINLASLCFVASCGLYGYLVLGIVHERFHLVEHSWINSAYYNWLEDIHILHHWDQRYNYTILHPAMDIIFGTYMDPKLHANELKLALKDEEISCSDLINWSYLLVEASPAEHAAFISTARNNPKLRRKLVLLDGILKDRLYICPDDNQAANLHQRAADLLIACGQKLS